FFVSSRRRHTRFSRDWSSDVCSSDLDYDFAQLGRWYEQIRPVLGLEGVVFTDIDESQNRLKIGVEAGAPVDHIQTSLRQYAVPRSEERRVGKESRSG